MFYVLLIINQMNIKNSNIVENYKGFKLHKPQIHKLLNFFLDCNLLYSS